MNSKKAKKSTGILLMLGAVIAFSIMGSLVRSKPDISSFTTSFYRFGVGLSILGILAITNFIQLKFVNKKLLIIRGVIGGFNVYLFYLVIIKLGVGIGTVLAYSYPVFASIFSAIFLKERISFARWGFIFMAICGLFILIAFDASNTIQIGIYEIIAIISAVTSAIVIVLVKKLHETDNSYSIFFSQSLFGFIIFFIPSQVEVSEIGINIGFLFLGIGIAAALGQLFMTESYFHINVTTGSVLILLVPVLNMLAGYLFFNEIYNLSDIIGAIIIISSCALIIISKEDKKPIVLNKTFNA